MNITTTNLNTITTTTDFSSDTENKMQTNFYEGNVQLSTTFTQMLQNCSFFFFLQEHTIFKSILDGLLTQQKHTNTRREEISHLTLHLLIKDF